MATNVGDPFLLAAYAPPHNLSSYAGGPSKLANVYASHHSGLGAEGHVLAAAQGDGVHILDLSTLHPIVSHTLGPSTVFSCPPVSRIKTEGGSSQSFVYAAMENIQGISPNERGRTVRVWIDNASGEPSSSSVKQRVYSAVLPHRVSSIVANDELPDNLLFVGDAGQVTVTDNEVNVRHAYSPADTNSRLIRSFAFGRRSCSFVPHRSPFKQGVVLVTLTKVGSEVHLFVLGAGPSAVTVIGDCLVPLTVSDIVDVSCSQSGFVSILTRSGEWHAYHIDSPDHTTLALSKPSSALSLKNLTFLTGLGASASSPPNEISLLSLGSSHVLLAGITPTPTPELALLLWDLQYGVLLACRTLSLPSSLNRDKTHGIDVHLAIASTSGRSTTQQALLVLGAKNTPNLANGSSGGKPANDAAQRSSVLVIPYAVPATSTVANALGRAASGEKWLNSAKSKSNSTSSSPFTSSLPGNLDAEQTKCVLAMKGAMDQKRVEATDEAFFAWIAKVDASKMDAAARPKVPYSYEFVRQVLQIVLPADPPQRGSSANSSSGKSKAASSKGQGSKGQGSGLYSPKVVRHLLEKRCVSSSMVLGGLMPALRLRRDWPSMVQAVKNVNDIPEDHLMAFLSATVPTTTTTTSRQREKLPLTQTDDLAMDVDPLPPTATTTHANSSPPPPLPTVLALCVTYSTSAPALRLAIRSHLSDAQALTSVLDVVVEWVRGYVDEERRFLPEGTKRDLHGALVPFDGEKEKKDRKRDRVPALEKILQFIQTVLDASFLTLLTHPPSHPSLHLLLSLLQPETELTDTLDQLRGPLEPFVKAHRKMVYEAAHGPEKPEASANGGADWRKKRKEVQERVGAAVGVYQVEELVL